MALRHATPLDPVLRELAILTVGRLAQCPYEVVHHSALAQRVGVRPEQIEQLAAWEHDPAFTTQERAVMRYAAEATQHVTVSPETFEALRSFLPTEHIVALVCNVAFYNMVVRVLVPLEVDLEEEAHDNRYR
jgi:AhpD family alkylhydroperoxidase